MSSASTTQTISPLPDRASRIDRFLLRFSAAGHPSERSMVKAFIDNHVRENGMLPVGTHALRVQTESFGFLGRPIDYSDLSDRD